MLVFFFKQKTAYEMRISDWSSDVCSSDLMVGHCRIARTQVCAGTLLFAHDASKSCASGEVRPAEPGGNCKHAQMQLCRPAIFCRDAESSVLVISSMQPDDTNPSKDRKSVV